MQLSCCISRIHQVREVERLSHFYLPHPQVLWADLGPHPRPDATTHYDSSRSCDLTCKGCSSAIEVLTITDPNRSNFPGSTQKPRGIGCSSPVVTSTSLEVTNLIGMQKTDSYDLSDPNEAAIPPSLDHYHQSGWTVAHLILLSLARQLRPEHCTNFQRTCHHFFGILTP